MERTDRNIYGLFADLLEYPSPQLAGQARECLAALGEKHAKARSHVEKFEKFSCSIPHSRLEELYTETFDIQAICSPYVGYHLFGEDRTRGMFMIKLKEQFSGLVACGYDLPDHLSLMLRFLDRGNGAEEIRELKEYCLIPAVKKMITLLKDSSNAYRGVLQAVLLVLEDVREFDPVRR